MIDITINNKKIEVEETTISELLKQKKINQLCVVIEINGKILSRELYDIQKINEGDKISIIKFVGGG